jgi:C4-dicarboxylate-specific signal transduction histidine kinase
MIKKLSLITLALTVLTPSVISASNHHKVSSKKGMYKYFKHTFDQKCKKKKKRNKGLNVQLDIGVR